MHGHHSVVGKKMYWFQIQSIYCTHIFLCLYAGTKLLQPCMQTYEGKSVPLSCFPRAFLAIGVLSRGYLQPLRVLKNVLRLQEGFLGTHLYTHIFLGGLSFNSKLVVE